MINPTKCVESIILNNPDLAEPLFDLLTWAAEQRNLKVNNDFDEIQEYLFSKTEHSRKAREAYASSRAACVAFVSAFVLAPLI